jgi:hypothetical protein
VKVEYTNRKKVILNSNNSDEENYNKVHFEQMDTFIQEHKNKEEVIIILELFKKYFSYIQQMNMK